MGTVRWLRVIYENYRQICRKQENVKSEKLNDLPSLFCRVRYVHTTKQTPRQKWLRHIWLCPPTTQSKKY